MNLNLNLFGIDIQVSRQGYTIGIIEAHNGHHDLEELYERGFISHASTYPGAVFKAWRRARSYAKQTGVSHSFTIFRDFSDYDINLDCCPIVGYGFVEAKIVIKTNFVYRKVDI